MREGKFELVVGSTGNLLAFNERVINKKTYAIADAGEEYYVKVNIYRDRNGLFSPARLRVGLFVDGNDVQYWKRIDLSEESILPKDPNVPVSATFWGFKKNVTDMRSFVFAKLKEPSSSSSSSSSGSNGSDSSSISIGSLHVVIYEASVIGGTFENKNGFHEIPENQSVLENKKFWQQASVSTSGGRRLPENLEKFNPLERWTNAAPEPLWALTLYYHTESTLNCIEALNLGSNYDDSRVSTLGKRNWGLVDLTDDDDDADKIDDTVDKSKNSTSEAEISAANTDNLGVQSPPIGDKGVRTESEEDEEVEYIVRVPEKIVVIDMSDEL